MRGFSRLFTYHRVNQLDTVVLRGVVAGSHHNTNPLPTKLLRTEASKQAHSENDGVEEVTAARYRSASFDVNKRAIAGAVCVEAGQIDPEQNLRLHAKL
jgi:hypothetical protein